MNRIAEADIHKICSGQVIMDLSIAVKELLENSIDAGATRLEIKLSDSLDIQLSDNGNGIDQANWSSICQKHSTSKLQTFKDLESISTFGFRGEALSALCQISQALTITTRTKEMANGVQLSFKRNGMLESTAHVSCCVGTIVRISQLFYYLPVRFREAKKRIKQEYSKVAQLLSAYALVNQSIKIFCQTHAGTSGFDIR